MSAQKTETGRTRRSAVLLSLALGVALAGVVALVGVAQKAEAAFPGASGKITFVSDRDGNGEIYVMNALDGSKQQDRTRNGANDER